MNAPTSLLAVAATALSAALSAQSTFVVSNAPGPGVDFTSLPAAVQAAAPGDTLQLRPGAYPPAIVQKGITIIGAPGVTFTSGSFLVRNVPTGEQFVLRQVNVSGEAAGAPSSTGRIEVASCDGVVLFEDITLNTPSSIPFTFSSCPRASLSRCTIRSSTNMSAINCGLTLSGCDIEAVNIVGSPATTGTSALNTLSGTLTIADSRIVATGGITFFQTPLGALNLGGVTRIGGATTEIRVTGTPGETQPISAISLNDGLGVNSGVLVDPAVTLISMNGGAPINDRRVSSNARTGIVPVPSAILQPTPTGQRLQLSGPANQPWFQFCGPVAFPVITQLGLTWIDPTQMMVLGMGTYDASGEATLLLPTVPSGMSMVMTSQTLVFDNGNAYVGVPTVTFCN